VNARPDTRAAGRTVACPGCGAPTLYGPANPFRPFCSERCRLIDLGEWAAESYRVPVRPGPGAPDAPEGEGET
jgi:endogenous inhibitor of DNA gyrase (YacG/DUF329 family)